MPEVIKVVIRSNILELDVHFGIKLRKAGELAYNIILEQLCALVKNPYK